MLSIWRNELLVLLGFKERFAVLAPVDDSLASHIQFCLFLKLRRWQRPRPLVVVVEFLSSRRSVEVVEG